MRTFNCPRSKELTKKKRKKKFPLEKESVGSLDSYHSGNKSSSFFFILYDPKAEDGDASFGQTFHLSRSNRR